MAENHIAHECALTEAATYEPASSFNPTPSQAEARPLPPRDTDEFEFDTEAEANAYWAGVADGIRNGGGLPAPRLAARARDHYPELVATAEQMRDRDILEFDPVSVRHRIDGWTPEKQREYVEALADSGVARYAAARVGMSEQSAGRLRRRADARSFDRACAAAMRIGARRLVSVAFERAIEGTVKRHYYHGELKSEERVYDNRLLMALIGKLPHLFEPEAEEVEKSWQPWMEAVEQGLPEPPRVETPEPEPQPDETAPEEAEDDFAGRYVWEEQDGEWRTDFPPPAGFDGYEEGEPGEPDYQRELTEAELAAIEEEDEVDHTERLDEERAARDRFFGFAGGAPEDEIFPAKGFEPTELYDAAAGSTHPG
jgi:hypothetical protein